jgi:hypothetical protein
MTDGQYKAYMVCVYTYYYYVVLAPSGRHAISVIGEFTSDDFTYSSLCQLKVLYTHVHSSASFPTVWTYIYVKLLIFRYNYNYIHGWTTLHFFCIDLPLLD